MAVITMTREVGSLGQDIAQGLAQSLNLKLIHHDTVEHELAGRLGMGDRSLHRYVEGDASIIERWRMDKRKLAIYTAEEVFEFAQHGNVLIRGWGAHALFRDIPNVMHVRVCAPMEMRARVMAQRLALSDLGAARGEIERSDAAQSRILYGIFGLGADDPLQYDVILNTSHIPVETCINMLHSLAQQPAFQETELTRQAMRDKLLEWQIRAVLNEAAPAGLDTSEIEPAVTQGKIELRGACIDVRQKDESEKLVRNLAGVREVENNIMIVRPWAY